MRKIMQRMIVLLFVILVAVNPRPIYAETLASIIVNDAASYVGKLNYVSGGTSLTTGVDCSGFICAIFEKYGYNLWGYRTQLRNLPSSIATGITCNINYALPGDIITTDDNGSKHVGIYAGNGYIINAANSKQGIVNKPYSYIQGVYNSG